MGEGTEGVVRLCELRAGVLSVDEVLAALGEPSAGGTALFLGTVRSDDHGRAVATLDYTAHPSASSRLRAVADAVAGEYPVIWLAVVHRVGALRIGDLAVVAGVACAHRAEAFIACRALIDRVKDAVPIWKHQTFLDGQEEWVGAP
ncbi:MAG TPA: molybdenum cofactor biosynthesis protein MoaE [Mycobacteriales bacterium]|nr:molybdenum cofactor biosynthesis protein MoaE [Mycobacteriales bacterium]